MRANKPLAQTDVPFLNTLVSTLVVAALPPPAVALAGPLCEPVSLVGAAERLVRSLTFGFTYVVFVYTSAPPKGVPADVNVILMRASAASIWTLGAAVPFLVLALPMVAMAILRRLQFRAGDNDEEKRPLSPYTVLPTQSPGDCYRGRAPPDSPVAACDVSALPTALHSNGNGASMFGALSFREVGGTGSRTSKEAMAAVAAALEEGTTAVSTE